jgi:hypothetical protein
MMRTVCDYVSPACGDPTTTHRATLAGHVKYVCSEHAACIIRHPSVIVGCVSRVGPLVIATAA